MKTIYKNKLLNLAATMAQSIGFNNAKIGVLKSSNVQDAIDEVVIREGNIITGEWDSTKTYTVGEYCIWNNRLYKCAVANTGSEPPLDGNSNWNVTSVGNELNNTMIVPDYENAVLIDSSRGAREYWWTPPSNGILVGAGYGNGQSDSYLYFTIGSVAYVTQGESDETISSQAIVTKGVGVKVTMHLAKRNHGLYFVPFKKVTI